METQLSAELVQNNLNIIWIIIAASLVMFMQAGFTALESGLTQAKNSINVAAKNMSDFIAAVLIFFLVGYGIMFGTDMGGLWGTTGFGLSGLDTPMDYAGFLFQVTFAGTAATIVSGAVAERIRFSAYMISSVVITAIIYPVSGHWIWGSGGWLAEMKMVDFAGSTVVHSLGGWVGLAGALVLGPRMGRFNSDGTVNRIPGQSLVLSVVGVLILWFGWFGFNGGSTLTGDGSVAKILVNTTLAAAAGGIGCFVISLFMASGEVKIEKLLNGVIAGLVGITAGCAVVEPAGAVLVGLSSGVVVYFAEWFLLYVLKIDDPVNAVAAHGFSGAWGTIALAIFAPADALPLGSHWTQLGVQITGVATVFLWAFFTGLVLFYFLKKSGFLRVNPDGERLGLNVYEHGASSGLLDTMQAMHQIANAHSGGDGDLTRRIAIEAGTEAGDMASIFNQFMEGYQQALKQIKQSIASLSQDSEYFKQASGNIHQGAQLQLSRINDIAAAVTQMSAIVSEVAANTNLAASTANNAKTESDSAEKAMRESNTTIENLAKEIHSAATIIQKLNTDSIQIQSIVDTITSISEQTNLLALNAAIEAARAGEQGRGFAVVADEVRNLSTKTQAATSEIKTMIEKVQSGAAKAVEAMSSGKTTSDLTVTKMKKSIEHLHRVSQAILTITKMNTHIADAAEEQNTAANEIKNSVQEIRGIAEKTAQAAQTNATKSESVAAIGSQLNGLVVHYKVDGVKHAA